VRKLDRRVLEEIVERRAAAEFIDRLNCWRLPIGMNPPLVRPARPLEKIRRAGKDFLEKM
jgi:hypothetical protein